MVFLYILCTLEAREMMLLCCMKNVSQQLLDFTPDGILLVVIFTLGGVLSHLLTVLCTPGARW